MDVIEVSIYFVKKVLKYYLGTIKYIHVENKHAQY